LAAGPRAALLLGAGERKANGKWAGRPFVLLGREKEQCGCGLDQQLGRNGKVWFKFYYIRSFSMIFC
jgi:hypothetical protein